MAIQDEARRERSTVPHAALAAAKGLLRGNKVHAPDRMEASRRVLDNNLAAHPSLQILFLRTDTPSAPINNFQEGTNNFLF